MPTDITDYRILLLQRRKTLQGAAQTGSEAAATVELDQSRVGRLSRMDALQGQAMSMETQRRREQELQRITQALQRIEQGDFGECTHCGDMITTGRLTIDPSVSLCIACADRQ